jgi:hypothetical protein
LAVFAALAMFGFVRSQTVQVGGQALDGAAALPASSASAPAPSAALSSVEGGAAAPGGTVPNSQATAQPSPAERAQALRRQINELALSRELTGEHAVSYDGRSRKVLGSKETSNPQSTQTVLLVRDDVSGQIDYWQSALQFVLKPGNDYEAFIRERPALQRRFVNVQQAHVTVDAANIAQEHTALSADPRVASVNFMPVAVRPTAK